MMTLILFLIVIISAWICGLLAAWTGQGGPKPMRRIVAPAIVTIFSMLVLHRWLAIILMFRAGVLSEGYGVPDPTDPKPSALGRFWFKILEGNYKNASIATRGTIGLQEGIVCSVIPFETGCWALWIAATILIIANWIYFGAIKNNEGTFKFFGKEFLWEEVEIHGLNALIILLLTILSKIL